MRELEFREDIQLKDEVGMNIGLKGMIVIRDEMSGRVLLQRSNMIVLRGRTFVLERIFGVDYVDGTISPADKYGPSSAKELVLFKVGNGGCITGDPFTPAPPAYNNLALGNGVPLRVTYSNDGSTALTDKEIGKYYGAVVTDEVIGGVDVTVTQYFSKLYETINESNGEWYLDKSDATVSQGQVFRKLKLRLSEKDLRYDLSGLNAVPQMNEVGLFFARRVLDAGGNTVGWEDEEMFSRVTFPTEPLSFDSNKSIIIEYYIYA